MKLQQKNLPRKVILLGWVSLLADISSEMIYPLIPIFLTVILGAPAITLGLIEGGSQLIVSVLTAYSGIRSDATRRRVPFVRWGYGLPVLGKAVLALAYSWHMVFVGKAIDRFGKGLRGSPRDALIADAVSSEMRGAAFGFHRMMDTAGAFLGVLIAALLFSILANNATSFRIVFAVSSLFALGSLAVAWRVKETESPTSTVVERSHEPQLLSKTFGSLGKQYWMTLGVLLLFAFANSSDTFLLLRAADIGLSPVNIILAYALYNFGYSILSYVGGRWSDSIGRWRVIAIGWMIYAAVYTGFAFAGPKSIWVLFALYGVYMALTDGVGKALIVDCVPATSRGAALGILYFAIGIAAVSSNLLAGYLWDNVSKSAPFLVGAGFSILAIAALVVYAKLKHHQAGSVV